MAKEFMLSAVLEFKDKMTAGIKSAQSGLKSLKSGIESVQTSGMQSQLQKAGASAEGFGKKVDGLKGKLKEVSGDHRVTITAQDNATSAAQRATSAIKSFAASGTKSANLRANDEATPIVSRLRGKLEALTGKAYNVNIRANAKGAEAGMMSKLGSTASGVAGGMLMNTSAQMAGAAGIGYGLYDMVKSAADFEQGMSGVAAISGATGDALQALTDKALEMGQTTKFTATESAQALNYMAMAGWNTDQMMSGLPGVMNLAAASGEDLAQVSDIVTDAMTAFKLPAEESGHFADVLAAAAANANTNVGMMGYTFKYAGSFAGALGYSIEDVALATGAMADSGVKADQAGTSLRALMERMAKPTKESGTAMDILGIKAFDAAGKARPLRDVLDELREKFKGLSGEDQAKFGAMLAGTEGSAGFLGMMNESQEKWDQIKDSIDNASGSAERMAKIRMDNLSGSVTLLGSAWESLSIKIMKGTGTAGGIRSFVDEATKLVTNFTNRVETDGLGFKSIAGTVGEAINDLKNKFLALDGVGSVLAGGALAAGLLKITQLTMRAADGIKGIFGKGSAGDGGLAGGLGSSRVGEMVVNAGTVIVNGKEGVGSAAETAAETAGGASAAGGASRASKLARGARVLGGIGTAVGVALGAYDMYSTYEENQKREAEANYGVDAAAQSGSNEQIAEAARYKAATEKQNQDRMGSSVGSFGGMLAGGLVGAKAGAAAGGAIGAAFGGIGAAPGAAIGGLLGGAVGAIGGSELGSFLGGRFRDTKEWAGNGLSNNLEYAKNGIANNAQYVGNGIENNAKWIANGASEAFNGLKEGAASAFAAIKNEASNTWQWITNGLTQAGQSIGRKLSELGTALEPVKNAALGVVDFFIGAGYLMWKGLSDAFKSASEWFTSNVWEPISQAASSAWDSITETASAVWSTITEAASTVADMFDTYVWTPITDSAQAAWELITEGASYVWDGITNNAQYVVDVLSEVWSGIEEAASSVWDEVVNTATWAWNGIVDAASAAADFASGIWQSVSSVLSSVWAEVQNTATWAWNGIVDAASSAWAGVTGLWNAAASWFESTVWTPIKSAVSSVRDAIVNAFNGALATIKGAWAGISGWFEANVIGPIKQKISSITSIGASIRLTGSAPTGSWTGATSFVPAYASGGIASFAEGSVAHGLAQVNEHGGELIDLPQGSRIYPAATTERMIERQLERETPASPSINISGNNFTVREEADIDKIAHAIVQQILQAEVNYGGAF
ncbi:MAG: phage tail tape measure protein [Veillonellaceae bacterium]|nr:phage tail tape measure protein [Veillonellaceae bacterium]